MLRLSPCMHEQGPNLRFKRLWHVRNFLPLVTFHVIGNDEHKVLRLISKLLRHSGSFDFRLDITKPSHPAEDEDRESDGGRHDPRAERGERSGTQIVTRHRLRPPTQ